MKKILTFALTALLLGGFVLNADAQRPKKGKSKPKTATLILNQDNKDNNTPTTTFNLNDNSQASTTDPDQMIKNYEDAVEHCLVLFDAIQNKTETVKANPEEFNKARTEAETLRSSIDAIKADLNRSQTNRFNKANKKLARVYK